MVVSNAFANDEWRTAQRRTASTNDRFQEVCRATGTSSRQITRPVGRPGSRHGRGLGAATGHIGVWVAAGIAAYIAISLVGGAWNGDRSK
jgi:hypothetical protein